MEIILLPYTHGSIANMEKDLAGSRRATPFCRVSVIESRSKGLSEYNQIFEGPRGHWGGSNARSGWGGYQRGGNVSFLTIPGCDDWLRLFAGWLESGVRRRVDGRYI